LPEIYRTVLVLRHYERMKLSDIAETLEIPLGTVNSRMAEALARLTRLLEPQFESRTENRTGSVENRTSLDPGGPEMTATLRVGLGLEPGPLKSVL
jgi:hypothetical protein